MRYTFLELTTKEVVGRFTEGDTVTIKVYDVSTGSLVALDDDSCIPLDDPRFFKWSFANLTTQPVVLTNYMWIMDNLSVDQAGEIEVGGWAERIPDPIGPANTCKITVNLSEIDGKLSTPDDVFSENENNTIELPAVYYADSRYFRKGKYKPSFDGVPGQAYWIMPQGAKVDIVLDSYGISKKSVDVPEEETVDLYTLLNPA
jgi:hypothetical protein